LPREIDDHLLHRLHEHQRRHRHISEEAMVGIAGELNLPRAQVEAVVEFYSFFTRTPRGRIDILFSNCTSCGSLKWMRMLCDKLSLAPGTTREDGAISIAETACIGMCDHGPSALVNGRPMTAIDEERIAAMAALIQNGSDVDSWPDPWFGIDDHLRRPDLLLTEALQPGSALKVAVDCDGDAVLEKIRNSGLRGRGGAGFNTAQKWQFCREAPHGEGSGRYVVCNADEGEPGTFKDRVLLTTHADALFEGMTLCARVIGAQHGFLYLRGEYRYLLEHLQSVVERRRGEALLGSSILGVEGFDFDIDIVVGAGAYICGEESALIESLEEKPGHPRIRPPFPVTHGYLGQPTVVNNVETLVAAAAIAAHDENWFREHGTMQSRGSKILSVSGDCARPGIYEYPFGVTIAQVLEDAGAKRVQAVQVGGPAGKLVDPDYFDHQIAFEDIATGGSFMIYDHSRDLLEVILNFSRFFRHESCGFCTPCRVGTALLNNTMEKLCRGHATARDLDEMRRTAALVNRRSHCGLGVTAPNSIIEGLKYFPELFERRLLSREMEPEFDLDASLAEARSLTHRDDAGAHL